MNKRTFLIRSAAVIALVALSLGVRAAWIRWQQQRLSAAQYEPPPPGMVLVPAGTCWIGSDAPEADPDEKPLRKVFVRAFYIDQFEVTNRRYREVRPDHTYPVGEDDLPVTFVLKDDAQAYCRAIGKRLPTGVEWEKAARGTDGRTYPWGNDFRAGHSNIRPASFAASAGSGGVVCDTSPSAGRSARKAAVGSFPLGVSPYGCLDMAGNAWEWVSDIWRDRGLCGLATGMERGVIRGGGYAYSARQARSSYQGFEGLDTTCHDVGFRCAMDAVPVAKDPPR